MSKSLRFTQNYENCKYLNLGDFDRNKIFSKVWNQNDAQPQSPRPKQFTVLELNYDTFSQI